MSKYDQARAETLRLNALLAGGTALADANESQNMNNLVRTGLSSLLSLINKTGEAIQATLNADQRLPQTFLDSQQSVKVIIDEINLACHRNDQAQSGKVILDLPLISDFWFDYSANTEIRFKESKPDPLRPFLVQQKKMT